MPPFNFLIVLCLLLGFHTAHAAQEPRIPTFSQCQSLANAKTSAQEKTRLTQLFKANNFYCSMSSAPFAVRHVFSAGQSKSQLRLIMGPHNKYIVDDKCLPDILIPDHTAIPPAQMIMLAGQLIGMLGDIFSSNFDPNTMSQVSGQAGALAGILGINARLALQQTAILRTQTRLNEKDIEPSFWLDRLSRIPAPAQNSIPLAAKGSTRPEWMQKLLGAGQHIMGTFHAE